MLENNFFKDLYYSWWKNIDKTIFFIIVVLFILGLFFSLVSTSLIASDKLNTNDYYFFFKHLSYVLIGILFIISISSLNEKNLVKVSKTLFLICLFFLLLVPFLGTEIKGSKRWLDLFFLPRFQPIELLKPFFIVITAWVLSRENDKNIFYKSFLSFFIILPIIFLLISQPDIGQSLLIFLTWLSLIFTSGINLIVFFTCFVFALFLLVGLVLFFPCFNFPLDFIF